MIRQQIRNSHFKAGDHALLRPITNPSRIWLTSPLASTEKVNVDRGAIPHSTIIGLKPRSLIKSKNQSYIVTRPTTEEYITLGKRAAQPIYHHDANAIVNLADIHSTYPDLVHDPVTNTYKALKGHQIKQYLEAGTGHASLSLSIAQRIHASNAFFKEPFGIRGAILHSIDNNPAHSKRGSTNLRQFQNGIYKEDVEFHVAEDLSTWFQTKECQRWKSLSKAEDSEEFLDGIFLDMPAIQEQLSNLVPNLKHDAPLITFVPSVTQIIDIMHTIQDSELPLIQIGTYQIGSGTNGGGLNEWDVKFTRVRKTGEQGVVCRPKVGVRVVGGGFVAVFRKLGQGMVRDVDVVE